jgi:trigger factor
VPKGVGVQVPSPKRYILPSDDFGVQIRDTKLNIEQQPLENHQVKLTVQIEPSKLEEAKHRAARKISQKKKIPGFRPGKAPYPIIVRTIGEEAIIEEALDLLVNDIYPSVIEEAKIKPYGPGSLENMPKLDPPIFEFIVPLEPEVILGDYKKIRIPYKVKSVTKKDINKVLEDLRERQVILEPSEQPASDGDQVYVKLNITRVNPAEGELPALVNDRRLPVVIDTSKKVEKSEWPYPGFALQLLGLTSGEEKTFSYTYPEDSDFKDLRGKETEVRVNVEEIKKRILPELNDEFAQSVGEQYETLKALTEEIRKSLEKQAKEEYDDNYNDKIMKEILKDASIKYPPQMLEREIDMYIHQLEDRLAQQKLDMETYLKMRNMDTEALHKETEPLAEERLKRTLVLLEISKKEEIKVENSELETESMRTLDELGRMMPPDKAKKTLTNEFVRGMIGNIGADLLVQHTWAYLQSVARGEVEEPLAEPAEQTADQSETSTSKTGKPKKKRTTKKVEKE